MNCPNCGNVLQEDAIFCDQCGSRMGAAPGEAAPDAHVREHRMAPVVTSPSGAILCPGCGAENVPGELFCAECGTPLEAPAPEQAVAASTHTPAEVASPVVQEANLRCAACGAEVRPGDTFCFACGARLADQQEAPEPLAPLEAVAATAAQEAPTTISASAAPSPNECPSCGAVVQPGDLFCDFCGAALTGADSMAAEAAQPQATETSLGGEQLCLVVVASGIELPLPQGAEVLVGREDPYSNVFPDVDLTPHGGEEAGVSRRHFKLTLAEGRYAIQDLGSTNYTWVNQQRLEPHTPMPLSDGDEIRAGRLKLIFRAR